jgi:hypothetical protein
MNKVVVITKSRREGRFDIAVAGFPIFRVYRSYLAAAKGAQALALRMAAKHKTTIEIRDFVKE